MFSFRDKKIAKDLVSKIKKADVTASFMHVCGTHQDTFVRHGIDSLLKECGVDIYQGPGCPVCVTTPREIEEMMLLAEKGVTVTSFGDMLQVPGQNGSLQDIKTEGADVRTVYSIEDSVEIAKKNPDKEVVFMAVGFETTAPSTASVILDNPPSNFSVLCCHRTMPNALRTILDMGETRIDGLIEPGHVSTIIGSKPYEFISEEYNVSQVIAGFEPIDVLMAAYMLIRQIKNDESKIENEYKRVVDEDGNIKAQKVLNEVFEPVDIKWRGFPVIPHSGLSLKKDFEEYDARKKYEETLKSLEAEDFSEPEGCRCGEVLRGLVKPRECPMFGSGCTPDSPIGPCMVSREGSCNIDFRYVKKR
ncbi:MAG: hydrogenase formation protein HypD [Candidatus Thermoplasmatota archaeon]